MEWSMTMSRGGGTLCALGADTSGDVLDSLFTTDMDQDEIVQTSDAEEREELDARGELYWQRQSSSSSTEHDSHPPPKRSKVHHYPFQGPSISPIPSCSSSSPPVSSSLDLAAPRAFSPLTPMIASSSALPSTSSTSGSPKSDTLASKVSRYYIHNDVGAGSADSEVQHSKRYSLRVRQAKQIKPYQYDKVFYQRQMRSNPDAIVNIVDTSGHQPKDQYQPKGETQADVSHQWERPRIVRRDVGHQECVHNTAWYPKALDGCSSSEDETNRETRGLAKEARRIRKQLKQNTEKERKKPKHFPLSERFMSTRTYNDGGWSDIETPLSDESSSRINDVHTDMSLRPMFMQARLGDSPSASEPAITPDEVESYSLLPDDDHYNCDADSDVGSTVQEDTRNSLSLADTRDHSASDIERSPNDLGISGERSVDVKGLRYLKKAWPAVMVNQHLEYLRESRVKEPRLATIAHPSSGEEGVLQPGQTRVRRVKSHSGWVDVRGDPESSDELLTPSEEDSGLDSVNYIRRWRSRKHARLVVEVPDTSEGGGSTDSDVDDPQINAWLRDKANIGSRGNRLKQENLIDWMLSRTRTIGAKNTRRQLPAAVMTRTQSPSKLDATSNQHSDVQQTVPSLHQPPEDITNITVLARHRVRGRGQPLVTAQKKRKLRHERGQASLHFFTSDKTHITSGRRRRHAITIDIEDEAFYKALAPVLRNTTDQPQTETTLLPVRAITRKQHMSVNVRHAELPGYQSSSRHRNIKLDFDIKRLPSGITFDSSTYIGRGWLHELAILVSGNAEISEPDAYAAHGIELIPTMTVSHFATVFTLLCDRLFDATSAAELFHWEALMHAVCQFVSWLPISANDEDCHFLQSSVQEQLLGLITRVNDWHRSPASSVNASVAVYTIHWFAIEVSVRLNHSLRRRLGDLASDTHVTNEFILLLMWHLLDFGWTRTLEPIQDCREHLDARSTAQRTAELWICLINLLGRSDVTQDHLGRGSFWQITQQCLESGHSVPSGLEASELAWQTIFALCTLSQFSSYGMTTSKSRLSGSWELVCFALKQIRLAAEPDSDRSLSERSLDKRDDYIWLVVSRCFILWNRWHWCLDNASEMFRHLADVFRSRKFANLRREPSDFPGFMLNNDVRLLSQYKPSDTAFELFLKLIVHAARSGPDANNDLQPEHASIKVNKLLSLIVPVGSVPFTKTTPPSVRELSMLYNRFGAIAVALYLDASPGNVHSRLSQARAYVKFKDADDMTRIACIRGAMHFAILMQDRQMPLDAVLLWLGDISMILVNEYSDIRDGKSTSHSTNMVRDRLIFSIQVLLGSVRRIIETPHMNPTKSRSVYPDPGLLEGAWVTRIFSNATNVSNLTKTSIEIRRLVQAFLDARATIMPAFRHPRPKPFLSEDKQDSQDNYGLLELDLDDAELLAALGEDQFSSRAIDNKSKDERVCKVIEDHISPAIYRLVTKYFGEHYDSASFEEYCHDADMWISCWVGCANILVQNRKKEWSWFLSLGPQSWERIIQQSLRRRVGLQFMFMLLQLDPTVYLDQKDLFIKVLLESLVSAKITIENEYMSLLFSVDGLQHPLLYAVPCQIIPGTTNFNISKAEFLTQRLPIMNVIFNNLAKSLCRETQGEQELIGQNQICVGFLVNMFSSMQDTYQQMTAGTQMQLGYLKFCQQVFVSLSQHPIFTFQLRLVSWIEWGSNLN